MKMRRVNIAKLTIILFCIFAPMIACYGQPYTQTTYKNLSLKIFKNWNVSTQEFPYFNNNGYSISTQSYNGAFAVTWVPITEGISVYYTTSETRKTVQELMTQSGLETHISYSEIYKTTIRGKMAYTFDVTISIDDYCLYKKVIVWEENGYQLTIEKAGDMPRESFMKYYSEIENSIVIR